MVQSCCGMELGNRSDGNTPRNDLTSLSAHVISVVSITCVSVVCCDVSQQMYSHGVAVFKVQ